MLRVQVPSARRLPAYGRCPAPRPECAPLPRLLLPVVLLLTCLSARIPAGQSEVSSLTFGGWVRHFGRETPFEYSIRLAWRCPGQVHCAIGPCATQHRWAVRGSASAPFPCHFEINTPQGLGSIRAVPEGPRHAFSLSEPPVTGPLTLYDADACARTSSESIASLSLMWRLLWQMLTAPASAPYSVTVPAPSGATPFLGRSVRTITRRASLSDRREFALCDAEGGEVGVAVLSDFLSQTNGPNLPRQVEIALVPASAPAELALHATAPTGEARRDPWRGDVPLPALRATMRMRLLEGTHLLVPSSMHLYGEDGQLRMQIVFEDFDINPTLPDSLFE